MGFFVMFPSKGQAICNILHGSMDIAVTCSSGRDLNLPELALGPSKNGEHQHTQLWTREQRFYLSIC